MPVPAGLELKKGETPMADQYMMAIQELSLSGSVSLGRCSESTAYRWRREINARLSREKADWRVVLDMPSRTLESISALPRADQD